VTNEVRRLTQQEFESKVIESRQPVLVDFYADWCAPCRVVGPVLDQIAEDYANRVDVYKVDVDTSPELASRFGVRSIPTLVVFKDGQPVETVVGVVTLGQINGLLVSVA
jgi:thioredoxin 1